MKWYWLPEKYLLRIKWYWLPGKEVTSPEWSDSQYADCLNPVNQKAAASYKQIETWARKLTNVTDDGVTYAADEWKVLEVEDNPHVTNLVPN